MWVRKAGITKHSLEVYLLNGNLVLGLLGFVGPFVTVFESISCRLPETGRKKKRIDRRVKICQNNPTRAYDEHSRLCSSSIQNNTTPRY